MSAKINNQEVQTWRLSDEKDLLIRDDSISIITLSGAENRGSADNKEFKIPTAYIRDVIIYEDTGKLLLLFNKDSSTEVLVESDRVKREIIDYLKQRPKLKNYSFQEESLFTRIKKPLIAGIIMTALFALSYFTALELERGAEVESLVIILGIAALGSDKLLFIYLPILAIVSASIYFKWKHVVRKHVFAFK